MFTDADFDAYRLERAGSNAFVRPRLGVKESLLALGRELAARAAASGLMLEVDANDERPSIWNNRSVTEQWVYLARPRSERAALEKTAEDELHLPVGPRDPSPARRHAFIGVRVDANGLGVVARVHREAWADSRTLALRLVDAGTRASVLGVLAALPDDTTVALGADAAVPVVALDLAALAPMDATAWSVERALPRAVAVETSREDTAAWIARTFDALLPVHVLGAWRADDDTARVADAVSRDAEARAAVVRDLDARASLAPVRPTALPSVSPIVATTSVPLAEPRPARAVAPKNAGPLRWIETAGPLVIGARVKVTSGPFAGQTGTVQALEARGAARVAIGALATRVELEHLTLLRAQR